MANSFILFLVLLKFWMFPICLFNSGLHFILICHLPEVSKLLLSLILHYLFHTVHGGFFAQKFSLVFPLYIIYFLDNVPLFDHSFAFICNLYTEVLIAVFKSFSQSDTSISLLLLTICSLDYRPYFLLLGMLYELSHTWYRAFLIDNLDVVIFLKIMLSCFSFCLDRQLDY